jgi:Zn-dependent protease with chaperone function
MVARGTQTAAAMFKTAQDNNRTMTWIIRVAGIVGLMIGFGLIMAPIGVLADVIPFLGSIARLGTGIIGFVLAILVGFLTIAIAWFAVRPILSIILIVVALAVVIGFGALGKKKDKARAEAEAANPTPTPAT